VRSLDAETGTTCLVSRELTERIRGWGGRAMTAAINLGALLGAG
jgi:hypothetical protein